nr:MAG TPA: hypothetical protein [Caudoviricetes sp.]
MLFCNQESNVWFSVVRAASSHSFSSLVIVPIIFLI